MTRSMRGACAPLLLLAACADAPGRTGAAPDSAGAPGRGGTAVVAVSLDAQTFNPLWALPEAMWVHQGLLSMPLFRYDAERRLESWLAERWDTERVAPDSVELTLRLRR